VEIKLHGTALMLSPW